MKVLHIIDTLGRGGSETLLLDVCNSENTLFTNIVLASGGGVLEPEFIASISKLYRHDRAYPIDLSLVKKIAAEKTEITAEELKQIEEERKKLQKEIEEKRAQYEAQAKAIMATLTGKTNEEIRKALDAAKIPEIIINKLAPKTADKKGGAAKGGAAKGGKGK